MERKDRLPELLSPAGDMESLYAAVKGGADAVYVGGKQFGARAYAKNFDLDELKNAVRYCHIHGVKLYVTVNTLVYDRELSELSDYAAELYKMGVDAVISADLGAISEMKRRAPSLEVHASTQMSVHNTEGADMAARLGASRVVLARELSLENIKSTTANCKAETEVFLHGALCVCHSGQCLFSSLVGGRSGNRGECAQPCRLPYNKGAYPLSLSDLSLANHIKELVESGVASLKIEGRMKSPAYVYTVTSIYRKLLDEYRNASGEENKKLSDVFSRGGFTDGYFTDKKDGRMTGVRTEGDKEKTKGLADMRFEKERVKAKAKVELKLGEPSKMTLTVREREETFFGEIPTRAINAPLKPDDVRERLSKTGATNLALAPWDIELILDEGINLSPTAINALRRGACEKIESTEREYTETKGYQGCFEKSEPQALKRTALFLKRALYDELENTDVLSSFDAVFLPLWDMPNGNDFGIYLPPAIFDSEKDKVIEMLDTAEARGVKYALVGNIGHIELLSKYKFTKIGDFRLNVCNSLTKKQYRELGISELILSPELTLPMARDIGGAVITFGRIPLMLTERCFIKENFGCENCEKARLSDRTGEKFPIIREYPHRNIILNSQITYMGDRKRELSEYSVRAEHFIFSTETKKEALDLIKKYKNSEKLNVPYRRIGIRK